MRFVSGVVIALSLSLSLAACGHDDHPEDAEVDCTQVTGADEFVVGLMKTGENALYNFKLMSADPAPPQRDDNTWVVQVEDPAGTPMDNMTLAVTPFMPAHDHGSPKRVTVAPNGTAGQYTLSPVNLWMPGVWETTIRAQSGTTSDTALFSFCIN